MFCSITSVLSRIDFIAIATVVMAIFTGCLWWSTKKMWKSTEKAADTAKTASETAKVSVDSYKVAERAWVTNIDIISTPFTNATVISTGGKMNGVMFSIQWINNGRTPAINLNLCSMNHIVKKGEAVPPFNPTPPIEQCHAPLIPGVKVTSPPCYFSDADIIALTKGEKRIFIYGRASYETIFFKDNVFYTEVTIEVGYGGVRNDQTFFNFSVFGTQNFAT